MTPTEALPTTPPPLTTTPNSSDKICLTDSCIQATAIQLARAFPLRSNHSEWCPSKELDPKAYFRKQGIILVKVPKAASSTSAGVALRIARRHHCKVRYEHREGYRFASRSPKSFMFTSIREPDSRAISFLNFREASLQHINHTEATLVSRLRNLTSGYGSISTGQGGFTIQFAALGRIPNFRHWSPKDREAVLNLPALEKRIHRMVMGYDFMLVVDRMDESLVALALLLDVDVGDVLVTSSKVAGSYFYNEVKDNCVSLTKTKVTPVVQAYLDSNDWRAQNYGDYLLHAVANRSLDLTIDQLGRDRFDEAMARYKTLQALEREVCAPHVQFPCSASGQPQVRLAKESCYDRDFGCGYKCIDQLVEEEAISISNSSDWRERMDRKMRRDERRENERGRVTVDDLDAESSIRAKHRFQRMQDIIAGEVMERGPGGRGSGDIGRRDFESIIDVGSVRRSPRYRERTASSIRAKHRMIQMQNLMADGDRSQASSGPK